MKKFILSVSVLVACSLFSQSCNAEITIVNEFLRHDMRKKKVEIQLDPNVDVSCFENDKMRVEIDDVFFEYYRHWEKGSVRKNFLEKYPNSLCHFYQDMSGGTVDYMSAVGILFNITNKTDKILFVDLNKSILSLGSYSGRPITMGVKYIESQTAILPPIVIPAKSSVRKQLFRGDARLVEKEQEWQVPSDLSVEGNLFGNGIFIFALGDEKTEFITMNFDRRIDKKWLLDNYSIKKNDEKE